MTLDEINVLGNLLNTTFGRSSTPEVPTEAISGSLDGDLIIFNYDTYITLYDAASHRQIVNNQLEIAKKRLLDKAKTIETAFNKHFKTSYKIKEVNCTHHINPTTFRMNGLPSHTLFQMTLICEVK